MTGGPDVSTVLVTRALMGAGLVGGLALASGVALTATSGWLIVRASEQPVILTLLTAIVGVRAFGMARPVLRYWERLLTHDAALRDLAGRRVATYASLIPLTPARLGRRGRASLLAGVVDDLDDVVGAQIRVTVPGISALVAWGLTTLVVGAFDVRVGAWSAVLGVLVCAICAAALRVESRDMTQLTQARTEVTRITDILTSQAQEIAAIGAGPDLLADVDRAQLAWQAAVVRQARGRAMAAGLILLAVGATTWAVAQTVAGDGRHTPAVAAMLVLAPVAAADALTPLAEAARALARARGSARRLAAVLDQSPAVAAAGEGDLPEESTAPAGLDSASAGDPASISWRRISAAWAADRPLALAPLDLDLPQGTHVSISGANGSGKSTALAVLARHLDPQSGRYDLGGRDALTLPLPTARGRIALVDDSPYLFASTVGANLRFAAPRPDQVCDGDLVAALQQAGLGAWYAALPDGLETRLGAGGRGISGGERARLALARAVLSRRPVILLDEPVAHLDAPTARAILADLLAASADRTLVMVSHREDGRDGFAHQIVLCPPVAAGGTRD